MSFIPNSDGAAVGNLFESASWTKELQEQYGDYPFNPQETYRMIDEIARLMKDLQIDGIAFDEEYIGTWLPPDSGQRITLSRNNVNIIRFMYELQAALDLLGEDRKIIYENYEIVSIPEYAAFKNRLGEPVTVQRNGLLDYTSNPWYGRWDSDPVSAGIPRDRYGPLSVAIADTPQTSPNPIYLIQALMKDHLYGGYGVVMYYCLRSRTDIAEGNRFGSFPWPADQFGADNRPETYLSKISETLHGQKTVFAGEDYRRKFDFAGR